MKVFNNMKKYHLNNDYGFDLGQILNENRQHEDGHSYNSLKWLLL